ncbi:hypothetical protein [Rhizobium sp. GR12]|uniref:hypothetical protein n=1 Tax=Rhizobium sp. GR12 TaxID=3053925 RepID=UPI002FBD5166
MDEAIMVLISNDAPLGDRFDILGVAIIGGTLMVATDFLGRTIVSPYQIPAGLVFRPVCIETLSGDVEGLT